MAIKEYDPAELQQPMEDQTNPASSAPEEDRTLMSQAGQAAKNVGIGLLKEVGTRMSMADDWSRKHLPAFMTNTAMGFGKPEDISAEKKMLQPQGMAQSIGKGVEQAGEFFIPSAAEEEGAEAIARMAPKLKPLARIGMSALGAGAVNKAQGGGFGMGAAAGAGGSLFGAGLRSLAPYLAESAMGVQGLDRTYGRTPGEAILQDTRGFRPETVRGTAQETMSRLRPKVENLARNSQRPVDLAPLYRTLDAKTAAASSENAPSTMSDIQSVKEHFTTPKTPGAAQFVAPTAAPKTSAEGALNLKRGLAKEFINRWTPERGTDIEKAARQAYGHAADAFHEAVPEARPLDERMSSLAPIIDRAGMASRKAGIVQGALDRFGRPTGALAPLLAGGYAGSHVLGFPGALAGGAAGAILPHVLASPAVQMFGARTLASPALFRGLPSLLEGGALQFDRPRGTGDESRNQMQTLPLYLRQSPLTPEVSDPLKPAIKTSKKGAR